MAGNFIRKKWAAHFKANDMNNDGVMDAEDADIIEDRFIQEYNMKGERARQFKANTHDVWNSLFLWDREKIDKKGYLEMMEKEYIVNNSRFVERHRLAVKKVLLLFDMNQDGLVSEDEHVLAMKCWGIEILDRKFIQAFPQIVPGYISNETCEEAWIAFHTNADENNADVERPVMFGFRLIDHM